MNSTINRSLSDQVVVITGAGRGIGLATAREFVAAGARVVIGDIDEDVAAKAALQIGGDTVGLPVDVADRASYADFLNHATQRHGPVDV
ncbi:MAG: SDR family NAD(P)-dependent oxidoreductase, partial [Nocardioides sp.]|nr:SDR family NAD(P)-dependent oxidoreductase [Nocardioides sp.]